MQQQQHRVDIGQGPDGGGYLQPGNQLPAGRPSPLTDPHLEDTNRDRLEICMLQQELARLRHQLDASYDVEGGRGAWGEYLRAELGRRFQLIFHRYECLCQRVQERSQQELQAAAGGAQSAAAAAGASLGVTDPRVPNLQRGPPVQGLMPQQQQYMSSSQGASPAAAAGSAMGPGVAAAAALATADGVYAFDGQDHVRSSEVSISSVWWLQLASSGMGHTVCMLEAATCVRVLALVHHRIFRVAVCTCQSLLCRGLSKNLPARKHALCFASMDDTVSFLLHPPHPHTYM
jgi:hypothetical protein